MTVDIHSAIDRLQFLLGTWHGHGRGAYPTIESFTYEETVIFGHSGKAFISYTQSTRAKDGAPLHAETGYIRPVEDGTVELLIAQPTGVTEIHAGRQDGSRLEFASSAIGLSATAMQVDRVGRMIEVRGDTMTNNLEMAAVGESFQWHLGAELTRQD